MKKIVLLLSLLVSIHAIAQIVYPGTPTTGTQEIIFDYSADKCNTIDIPDAPARAFRDADGTINFIASHYTTWRMTGNDFSSLVKDCTPVMTSDQDSDPATYNNNEWIVAPYTTDGINIHALVHNEYVPCGNANNCWYNSITYVSSSDSGRTYSHTTAPSHLVAASPYESPYPSTHVPFGLFGGSNIIFKDGYYYKMLQLETYQLQQWGAGIIRTNDLTDPTSWRGWDGTGFNVEFVNPYTESGFNPADKVLAPVSRDNIGKMCASLTYNTYFGKYMVVDYTIGEVNGALIYGFYYALSDDLINWSAKRLIMQTAATWAAGGSNYPSIIDHADTSRNFEMPGQDCYLYFTKWNSGTYDRDLIRVPVTFNKEIVASLVVNSTLDTEDKTPGDGKCLTLGNVCTLRAALQEANARPPYDGYDTLALPITFNIAGSGLKTISPASIYSDVFYPVHIDGYTQSGATANTSDFDQGLNTVIKIAVDATHGGPAISFHAGNNVLEGISFVNGAIDFLYEDEYSTNRNNNTIKGCFIGMEADGLTPGDAYININNQHSNIIGGITDADRNLIGGGILLTKADSNHIMGNYIGTTASGLASSGTSAHGIQIADSASYNLIGGTSVAERNLISGGNRGIMINYSHSHDNSVIGNYIGVGNDGVTEVGNANAGILLSDSTYNNIIQNNIIGDNSYDEAGIWIDNAHGNSIQSNYIGTDSTQTAQLGNGDPAAFAAGIMLLNSSSNNIIGGSNDTDGNVIANNVFGISMYSNAGAGNSILSNIIYDNTEMGIDLFADYSVQANDANDTDSGPNDAQNYPELTGAYTNGTNVTVVGTFNSIASANYTIQYYSNTVCDPSENGEGKVLLATETVTADNSGNVNINAQINEVVATGAFITALATDANGNTSEFSACILVQSGITPVVTNNSGDTSLCDGDSILLTSSLADSYTWSNGDTTQSIVVYDAGTYSVTVDSAGFIGSSESVTIVGNPKPSVSISGLTLICNGGSTTLTASGADSFVWTGGPSTAAYTFSPTVTDTLIVTGTITATGCTDTASQIVTVETCTGIANNTENKVLTIFPNPTNDGLFTISIENSNASSITISIVNVLGKEIYKIEEQSAKDYTQTIHLKDVAKGIYYIRIHTTDETLTRKIVLK
jgi:CSLREA domain-containing protein